MYLIQVHLSNPDHVGIQRRGYKSLESAEKEVVKLKNQVRKERKAAFLIIHIEVVP